MSDGGAEPLVFQCEGSSLVGILHRAAARCEVAVLVIVGGPQYRVGSHRQFVLSARSIAAAGYPVLRFDYRGMGDSGGEHAGFEHVAEDISAAVGALCAACDPRRGVVLLGLCDAAAAAMKYCCTDPRIAGLILMNPWVRSGQSHAAVIVERYYLARLLQGDFWRKLVSGGFDFLGSLGSLARNLWRAARRAPAAEQGGFVAAMRAGLERFSGPALLVLSGRDLTAAEFRARCRGDLAWQEALSRPGVEVVDLPDADHTFSGGADLAQFNESCKRWLGRKFGGGACP